MRAEVARANRVVVKIGSSSLTNKAGLLDEDRIRDLAGLLSAHKQAGKEVVLVTSGAIAAALGVLGMTARPRGLAAQQAAASVGQGLLLHRYTEEFAKHNIVVGQVLLTLEDVTRRSHYRKVDQTFTKLLELGVLPIVNENDAVATAEIKFGDNDRLAALVAHLVRADLLVLLTDVAGLFDGDPKAATSSLISEVTDFAELSGVEISGAGSAVGSGGMVTKVDAARVATAAGIEVVLTQATELAAALAGADTGTHFVGTGKRRPHRLLWLAHAGEVKGAVQLDAGAVRAVKKDASLLAAGVIGVSGSFSAGDPIEIQDEVGVSFARGLVNYEADEIPRLQGKSTQELVQRFGAEYEREIVHRDDLILL